MTPNTHFTHRQRTTDTPSPVAPRRALHATTGLLLFVVASSLSGCADAPGDAVDNIDVGGLTSPGAGLHGFMIVSDRDPNLAVNAYGGAQEGTLLRLARGCTADNGDCTWSYKNGMLLSGRDGTLAVNAWGGATNGGQLLLTRYCTPDNPDCTWTYHLGRFISDTDSSLAINAYGGAAELAELRVMTACTQYPNHPDCTWTMQNTMLDSGADLLVAPSRHPPARLAVNAAGGAVNGANLLLSAGCSQDNPDCTFTVHKGMIVSDRDPSLAVNAYGGAEIGTSLRLVQGCSTNLPDCTWKWVKGMIFSDRDWRLAVNAWGGRADGAALRLSNQCAETNPDCLFPALVAGAQCGHNGQGACPVNVCAQGVLVNGVCRVPATKTFVCPTLDTGGVAADAMLGVSNLGDWSFVGHAYNNGFWGNNFTLGIGFGATDGTGQQFGVENSGIVHGSLDIGSREDSFTHGGHDAQLIDNWDAFVGTIGHCGLHVSTNPWLVGEAALVGLGVAVGGAVAILSGPANPNAGWDCHFLPGTATYYCSKP